MSEVDPVERAARPQAPQPPARYYPLPPAPPAAIKPIPRWVWIGSAILVLAFCGAMIPVYRYVTAQWHKADPLIAGLHQKMAQGDDAGIFAESDPLYQEQVGLEKSNRLFDNIRAQLGAPQSTTCMSQFVSANSTDGTMLTLTFNTIFDKGVGTETLKLHKENGVYRMIGYHVFSSQLKADSIPAEIRVEK
jgi:hypothetical protein